MGVKSSFDRAAPLGSRLCSHDTAATDCSMGDPRGDGDERKLSVRDGFIQLCWEFDDCYVTAEMKIGCCPYTRVMAWCHCHTLRADVARDLCKWV